jgi:hypothetical protein
MKYQATYTRGNECMKYNRRSLNLYYNKANMTRKTRLCKPVVEHGAKNSEVAIDFANSSGGDLAVFNFWLPTSFILPPEPRSKPAFQYSNQFPKGVERNLALLFVALESLAICIYTQRSYISSSQST